MASLQLQQAISSASLFAAHPRLPDTNDPFLPLLARYFPVSTRPVRRRPADNAVLGNIVDDLRGNLRWRELADWAAAEILSLRSTGDGSLSCIHSILKTWVIRFTALQRLHLYSLVANETQALFALLPPFYPHPIPDTYNPKESFFHTYIPFEIIAYYAVLPMYLGRDRYSVLEHLQDILQGCKREFWRSDRDAAWERRIEETGMAIANVLTEMRELAQAAKTLEALIEEFPSASNHRAVFLLYLEMGHLGKAEETMQVVKTLKGPGFQEKDICTLEALLLLSQGKANEAETRARRAAELDVDDAEARNNLAASQLYTNRIPVGVSQLRSLAKASPFAFYNSEASLSNMVVLQEMRAGNGFDKKLSLLKEAASVSGEGVKIADALRI